MSGGPKPPGQSSVGGIWGKDPKPNIHTQSATYERIFQAEQYRALIKEHTRHGRLTVNFTDLWLHSTHRKEHIRISANPKTHYHRGRMGAQAGAHSCLLVDTPVHNSCKLDLVSA